MVPQNLAKVHIPQLRSYASQIPAIHLGGSVPWGGLWPCQSVGRSCLCACCLGQVWAVVVARLRHKLPL